MVCQLVHRFHISQKKIDDSISKKTLQRYIDSVDPLKLYFIQSDIEAFKKLETKLDDQLVRGDVKFAYLVHQAYLERVRRQVKIAQDYIQVEHDFTTEQSRIANPDHLEWCTSGQQLNERWRKRIKAELLAKNAEHRLELASIRHITDSAAVGLAKYPVALSLPALRDLSDAAAESLSKHEGELALDLETLPNSAAEILRQHPSFQDG